ncbi:UDP-N-acetylglucosamine 4,6-dehydratase [compost metagenome]
MSRFMMTLEQATNLTIDALKRAQGGEVFVLKMPVIRLQDLAECVVEEVCKQLKQSPELIQIDEIGLRPGEKMYEELMTEEESTHAYELDEMFVIPNTFIVNNKYQSLKPAQIQSYSSHGTSYVLKEEVRKLILENNLIKDLQVEVKGHVTV